MSKKTGIIVSNVCIALAIIVALVYVVTRFVHWGVEFTDNAQVARHISPVNSRVQGFIREIRFKDFQHVKKGDTLAIIDDTDFRLQVAQANAALVAAQSGTSTASAGVQTVGAGVAVSDAQIAEGEANLANALRNKERYDELFAAKACTQQERDNMVTLYEAQKARLDALYRAKAGTKLAVSEQGKRLEQSEAGVDVARAALDLAQQNLGYTVIIAPADGIVGRKDVSEGQLVQPGQTIVSLVWDSEVWVIANFRETQLSHIAAGSDVLIKADALPGVSISGKVERLSNATGAAFSLIPQDNATGNFVKVEQRVPVRISLDGNEKAVLQLLKAGLNVECEVKY